MNGLFLPWTDAEDAILRRMWESGCSARQISQAMRGRTRCSIISRANRLGYRRPDTPDRAKPKPVRPPAVRRAETVIRRARVTERREGWEALKVARDACVFCGVREDQHETLGCRHFQAKRAA